MEDADWDANEALEQCIALYAQQSGKTRCQVRAEIHAELDARQPVLTLEQIERRDFTYVSVVCQPFAIEEFLVATPRRDAALRMAKRYVARKHWVLQWRSSGACQCCGCYALYPRNYVRKARRLFEEGKF